MKIINKILFCLRITADLPSFFRLIIHSKKLSRSKSRKIAPEKANDFFSLNIKFKSLSKTIFLRTYKGDIDIFYEIFQKEIYSLPAPDSDVRVIVDLGANIGLSALYFTALYPAAIILCVEPGKANFEMLLKNLGDAIQDKRVKALQAAVSSADGMVSFEDGTMHYNGKIVEEGIENTVAIGIKSLLHKYRIEKVGLMKIDVEGSEKELFEADVNWLGNVSNIIIETHSEGIRDTCIAVLEHNKFIVRRITADPRNENLFRAKRI